MKIALVTPYDFPYPGGVTEHVQHLDREFRARGHNTRIIAGSSLQPDSLSPNVIKVSSGVFPIPFNGSTARVTLSPLVYPRLQEILNDEQFDVVHVHEPAAPLLSWAALRESHAVTVGTFHAYWDKNELLEYTQSVGEQFLGRLDGRIYVSSALRDVMTHYFPGDYRLIPNGIDVARFAAPGIQPIHEFDDGRPNILFVGRMEPRKGFRHLLRAYPYIRQALPDARLLVVGAYREDEIEPFVRYAQIQGLGDIHFVGRVSREDLARYYRTATVYCAPSTGGESFGIVLLEAMAAGAPIVASDIAGYRSVLTHGTEGYLVPPGDEGAIANAIIGLVRDPETRARMAAQGRATAAQYDWQVVAPRVLDYYGELRQRRAREAAAPSPRGYWVPSWNASEGVGNIRGLLGLRIGQRGAADASYEHG